MPTWQAIVVFCFALATTMYFKFMLPEPDCDDAAVGERDTRIARLERYRMQHGACVHCGEPLSHDGAPNTPTCSRCPHCGPDVRR